ncbi:elongation factor 1-gamma-like [Mytilus trossulus]|uniref:elongation factor 1-gamma-like n=1 Tax=Mytilus trossulus TaxID=6551 RepID=UPI00300645C2
MATGTLYTYPDNFRAFKAQIAAEYSRTTIKLASFKFGETNQTPDFLSKFPLGKVPAFVTAGGDCLFESNAIAHFLGNTQLRGKNDKDASFILQWINFGDNEILPASCTWVYPCLGIVQYNKTETERAKAQVKKALSVLDNYLLTRTYLVGERITQADISVACNLLSLYKYVLDPKFVESFTNVNRWFKTLVNQPQFKKVIGDFKFCEKMAEFDAKKYQELHGKADGGKKEKKPADKPKAQPKKEKPAKKDDDDEDDDDAPKKNDKDPFAPFPAGKFNMDEFKREYSNKDTLKVALPYFWNNFEKDNYSIWYCEYKYSKELTKIFMTCNLIGGFFQRVEKLRKNAFGSMCIFGEDNKNSISGVWFWRGPKLAFELTPDWQIDYESYEWKKLDPTTAETKKMVEEYWNWEGDFGGKKFNQGKIFK